MLDKTEFYHGAAIVHLLNDRRCMSVRKLDHLGYIVNDDIFVLLKYTTKPRTPWGFTFDTEDVERCMNRLGKYRKVVVGLVCAGDGVCALDWHQAAELLDGKSGRIAAARKHSERYGVWGSGGELKTKVSQKKWPEILFD